MPELPEVEVVRRGVGQWATGRRIETVEVFADRSVRRHEAGPTDFARRLVGASFSSAERRGKYLWLPIDGVESALVVHLGMSGQCLMLRPDAERERHLRVRFRFDDNGMELRFVDQRMFGGVYVDELIDGVPKSVAHIALDPLDERFDVDTCARRIRTKTSGVKRVLLDQSTISGVGNIYADEALWRARLHYEQPAEKIPQAKVVELIGHIQDVMNAALAVGGTSFDSLYVNVNGESGYFSRDLDAYGREGEPCHRCGRPILREPWMNRSSYRCPNCQRR